MRIELFPVKEMQIISAVIVAVLITMLSLTGCGKDGNNEEKTFDSSMITEAEDSDNNIASDINENPHGSPDGIKATYSTIMASDHISVDDAYEQLKDNATTDPIQTDFIRKLKDLKDCSGKFANTTEKGNVYGANISFYLSGGKIYSTATYSGYMGEIGDSEVKDSEEEGYLFESAPKGDLYGKEQDFHLYFGKDKLRIMWGDSCDYLLDRGDGSAEAVEDYKVPFEESDTYKKIESLLDENFADIKHELVYSKEKSEFNVYFQAPDNLRDALNTKDSKLMDSWKNLVDFMKTLSESLLSVVQIGGKAEYANVYWVDQLKNDHSYSKDEYLAWIQNGIVKYNYADHLPVSGTSGSKSTGHTAGTSSESVGGSATFGEKNALEKAHQYLEYSAFSYTGLIDQLEFEGYTRTEAVYAADNCGADWNEQAVKKAKQYLDYSSFSRSELMDQLEFEGFTHAQAEYAVNQFY